MKRKWGLSLIVSCVMVIVFALPAMAATNIESLSLDKAIDNALKNSVDSVKMNQTVTKLENQKKLTDDVANSAWDNLKKYKPSKANVDLLNQSEYESLVVTPGLVTNQLNSAYLAQKQLNLVTRITTATAYFKVAACGQSEVAAGDSLTNAQQTYKDTQAMYKQGTVSKIELLNSQIQVQTAKMNLSAAKNATAQAKRELCIQMGIAADTQFKLSSQLTYKALSIKDDLAAAQNLRDKDLGIQMAKITLDSATLNYNLMLRVYQPGTYNYNIGEADYNIAQKEYDTAQNKLLANSQGFIDNLHQAETQYLTAKQNKEMCAEVYQLAELKFKSGVNTQNDVLKAAAQLSNVEAQEIAALLQYNTYLNAFNSDYILVANTAGTN